MDKKALKSKKFIAYFFSSLLLGGILIAALMTQQFTLAMSAFMSVGIFSISCLAIGYVFSQATLDKFINGVTSLADKNKEVEKEE